MINFTCAAMAHDCNLQYSTRREVLMMQRKVEGREEKKREGKKESILRSDSVRSEVTGERGRGGEREGGKGALRNQISQISL